MDCGLQFANRGHRTVFSTLGTAGVEAGALVLSSRSRTDRPAIARAKVFDLATSAAPLARRIYKKIDSTLRGNIGSELDAIFAACGISACILNPAYPQQSRTVVNGLLLVDGVEVARSEIGTNPADGVSRSNIVALLADSCNLKPAAIPLSTVRRGPNDLARAFSRSAVGGAQVIVPDAESDGDLANIAAAAALADLDRLVVGSAGLADHLEPAREGHLGPVTPAACDRVVVIAGSFTSQTARQVAVAGQLLGQEPHRPDFSQSGSTRRALAAANAQLQRDGVWIAHPGHVGVDLHPEMVDRLVEWIGTVAGALASGGGRTGFVFTGGETAAIALEKLAASAIEICFEIQPGIPGALVSGGVSDGLPVVTKAGGFGNDAAIYEAIAWLRSLPA